MAIFYLGKQSTQEKEQDVERESDGQGYYCNTKFQQQYIFHIEHTFPLSRVVGTDIPVPQTVVVVKKEDAKVKDMTMNWVKNANRSDLNSEIMDAVRELAEQGETDPSTTRISQHLNNHHPYSNVKNNTGYIRDFLAEVNQMRQQGRGGR